jgi:DNA-binding transcriptional LysR family regulator
MTDPRLRSGIPSRVKTRQLALLVHLDDARCVQRAAEASDMTQPAASKLLREVEDALEVKLFDRHARGVTPTWYGEILVRHARLALSAINLAQEEIANLKAGFSGRAALGSVMGPATNLIPQAVAQIKQQYPAMLVSVEVDYSKPLVAKLLQGQVDMLVARVYDTEGAEALRFEPLGLERHAVIAGAHHPLAGRGDDATLEDLVCQPWVLPAPGSLVRDHLMTTILRRGLPVPKNIVETTSLPLITSLLRTSNMIAPLPVDCVRTHCEAGLLTVLLRDLGVELGSFGIITRRDHGLSPGARLMLGALREAAAKLYAAAPA